MLRRPRSAISSPTTGTPPNTSTGYFARVANASAKAGGEHPLVIAGTSEHADRREREADGAVGELRRTPRGVRAGRSPR